MVLMPADYVSIKNAAAQIFECKMVDESNFLLRFALQGIVLCFARRHMPADRCDILPRILATARLLYQQPLTF